MRKTVIFRFLESLIIAAALLLESCGGGGGGGTASVPVLSLLAGNSNGSGSADGMGAAARFNGPAGVVTDASGSVYVADSTNSTIRKITPAGVVTTLAGTAGVTGSVDGTGAAASFNSPTGVATDASGNVYVADTKNSTIRRITPAGVVSTLAGTASQSGNADGTGAAARFSSPTGVATDASGNIYVADKGNNAIRKITPAGVVTTRTGFNSPAGVTTDASGNVYVADTGNNTIRKITPAGVVTTLAGRAGATGSADGTGAAASFNSPTGVVTDASGNVYVADFYNFTIRKITPAGVVTTLAGTAGVTGSVDEVGVAARFSYPAGVATDASGNVYVADGGNDEIRKITSAGVVTTLAGQFKVFGSADGTGAAAGFRAPAGIATDAASNVYVADFFNATIRKVTPGGVVTTLAGGATSQSGGVATDASGNVYVADTFSSTIRKITPAGAVTTLAGTAGQSGSADATGTAARFNQPYGVATDAAGNVYVADTVNFTIRKITPTGVVTTLAGTAGQMGSADATGAAARFNQPYGVATDAAGNVYVADTINNTIRKITSSGVVTTLAGAARVTGSVDGIGTAARFYQPIGIATDASGNVYVADSGNHTIRKITPDSIVSTLVGSAGSAGFAPGALPGLITNPSGIALFGTTLYTTTNNAIVRVTNLP